MSPNYWFKTETLYLKKDVEAHYIIDYKEVKHHLRFRFTLHVDKRVIMHYKYDDFVNQNVLFLKYGVNDYKRVIIDERYPYNPYFLVQFKEYKDNIATFNFFLYNPKQDIGIKLENQDLRKLDYVRNLPNN